MPRKWTNRKIVLVNSMLISENFGDLFSNHLLKFGMFLHIIKQMLIVFSCNIDYITSLRTNIIPSVSRRAVFRLSEANMIIGALNPSRYLYNASGYIKELQMKKNPNINLQSNTSTFSLEVTEFEYWG